MRYRPISFFSWTFAFSWVLWFAAAWCSRDGLQGATLLLSFLGLLGPVTSALIHLRRADDAALWRDFKDRLVNLRRLNWRYLPATLLLMPVATGLAIWISLTWGAPASQWTFIRNLFAMLPLMFLAPFFEELGWRGYGVDALRARMGMGRATAAFAALWTLWHAPLFLIDHTYQHDLRALGPIYVANFFVSVVPAAIVSNWLYYKHRRSIAAAVLFHFMLDAVAEGFRIEPSTKCIITVVFLAVAVLILAFDRKAFVQPRRDFIAEEVAD
jgi:membrane protease YdiL (CAAX protease family)